MPTPRLLTIADIRGGVNDSDSPISLKPNEVVEARNVDLRDSTLGSKRGGTSEISLSGSVLAGNIVALIRHQPTNDPADDELWAIDETGDIDRRVAGAWAGGVTKVNNHIGALTAGQTDANGVSLHGKLFLAATGTEDRLIVWDGTVLRWAGIAQPPDPTVGNTGVGTYTGTRYFRIRYIEQVGGVTVRRSEPSNSVSLAPSGTGSGALITKPAGTELVTSVSMEGQTHWEVEASLDDVLFYRIATVAIGTSTYTDTTVYATGYAANTLSEQIGEYVPPGSARLVAVDEDRVVMAGNRFEEALDSTAWWTPVEGDDGVGNDERIPTATLNYINFDGQDGGGITGLVAGVRGNIYVFKRQRIYKMVRTGQVRSAYDPYTEGHTRGALMLCVRMGTDAQGMPCLYFMDPDAGLCRIGSRGIEDLAGSVRTTWKTRNPSPTYPPRLEFYPDLEQVWCWAPLAASAAPDRVFFHETRYGANFYHDGTVSTARCSVMFPEATTLVLKPHIGVNGAVHKCDTGTTDNGTNFRAYVRTKPYALGSLFDRFGLMGAVLLGLANAATTITVKLIRDYGLESRTFTTSLAPSAAAESRVTKIVDDVDISTCHSVQVEYGDASASAQEWTLDTLAFRFRDEDTAG